MQIIDYCVLFSTILVVILIGWLSGRNTCCTDSSKEFLLTEKGINKLQAGFSMAATDFGGSGLVGAIGYCYFVGISGIWWNLAAAPAFILVGLFLAKKFNRMDCATLPEYFGKRYGKGVKLLSCILHILTNIAALSVQFTVSCTVLHIITGFNINVSLVISVLIVLFLTSGGLRAVVNTDAVLFIIIVISILLMVPFSIRAAGGYATLKANVPVEQVQLGDVLMVLPGETVPVDGELLSGTATLDLSNINGEPVPREVFAGARVMSGAVNGSTALTMRATQVAADSQYQRILELVASAQESRPAVVKTADRLAVPFTVLSLVIAGVAWAVSGVPTRFAQVLVLATPCPLLIAAPVAYIAGTGRLAAAGVLIKAQDVLENLGRVTQVFFDKTGTLTVKQPQVVRVEMLPGAATRLNEDHVLMMAGAVESYSVHILSKGIAKAGAEALARLRQRFEDGQRLCPEPEASWPGHGREYPVVKNINEDAGKGVSGEVNGHAVRVGRLSFAAAGEDGFLAVGEAAPLSPRSGQLPLRGGAQQKDDLRTRFGLLQPDEMASYVSVDGRLIARIVLRDVPRANAKAVLAKLHELGVTELAMLTGDKRASANIIASEVGIDEVHAELFPEDKVAAVRAATGAGKTVTMMVGDGVNDAPVLAVADIGVAMTDGTSTAASESAQVVIMNDNIAAVPRAIAIARRTKRVMLQAVIAGLVLATIGMIAAAFNLIPVVVGAFLQEAIDVVSILWALTALIDRD